MIIIIVIIIVITIVIITLIIIVIIAITDSISIIDAMMNLNKLRNNSLSSIAKK